MARAGLTPEGLVLSAAELADERGIEAVTVSELARRAGVRTASLYAHLDGSDDLRTRLCLLSLEEMAVRVTDAVAGLAGRDAVGALATAYRSYAREHPGRYAASRVPLDADVAAASAGPRHATTTRAVLQAYRLSDVDATHGVRLLGSTVHGFIALESTGGFEHSEPSADASWGRILDGLHDVFTAWGS